MELGREDCVEEVSTTLEGLSSEASASGGSSEGSPTLSPKIKTGSDEYPPPSTYENLKTLKANGQIQELQTILRNMYGSY